MNVNTGLDSLVQKHFKPLKNKKVALLCNQASIAVNLEYAIELFYRAYRKGLIELQAFWGPQHGLWGHTQDNMIEWEGYLDKETNIGVYSLYGKHRKPTGAMLNGLDVLVVDLLDVGSKYYTFIWTLALCMEACAETGIAVVVLDRPNPIGGEQLEGPFLNNDFRSLVGLYSLTIRHGMTIGEIARYLKAELYPNCRLQVIRMEGWKRNMYFEDTHLPWAMPSPNIPTPATAVVYPGMCLLEATNISEGRGTTRPFEIFGAPWISGWEYARALNAYRLPGVYFRPYQFQPTFHKYQGTICEGCYIHISNRRAFKPFLTGIAILRETIHRYPKSFRWKEPPYEYEYRKMPFDILVGNGWIRKMLDGGAPLRQMEESWEQENEHFVDKRRENLLY